MRSRAVARSCLALVSAEVASHPDYDVSPDGRFLMLKRIGAESQPIVVHNWGRELREKTAPRK